MAISMRGASAESLEALVQRLESAVASGADSAQVADELFGLAALLGGEPSLRRVLTDLSRPAEAKAELARRLFTGKLSRATVDLLADAAGRRWAATRDLGDSLEYLGVVGVVKSAEQAGKAEELEHELFAFGQLVTSNPALRDALSDPARSVEDKRGLLRDLLGAKVTPATLRLVEQTVSGFHRTVSVAVSEYQEIAAANRNRMVATVRVARPLSEGDRERLRTALHEQYGRPVHLNVVVDAEVLGGVKVEIGNDVIDGTVASRLDEARRRLAG